MVEAMTALREKMAKIIGYHYLIEPNHKIVQMSLDELLEAVREELPPKNVLSIEMDRELYMKNRGGNSYRTAVLKVLEGR